MFTDTTQYTSTHFRLQVVHFMALNYEYMYPKLKHHISGNYKQWLMNMMDPQTDGDTGALIGCRHLLQVSYHTCKYFFFQKATDSTER